MVTLKNLPLLSAKNTKGYRLINSKLPPIHLFDDVADADEFEMLYQLQVRTNPRLQNAIGRIELIPKEDIPFGITGCSYATAPFTHINPYGSRFSHGAFGVLYIAENNDTAIAEVKHHQQRYWENVEQLHFERFTLRGLACNFEREGLLDLTHLPYEHPIYHPEDYSASQALGAQAHQQRHTGLAYRSVRNSNNICWALFTPRVVTACVQHAHYEMIWDGKKIASANKLTRVL